MIKAILMGVLRLVVLVVVVLGLFSWLGRSWFMTWGATPEEINKAWPGDELSPQATNNAVRGITINASPEKIWPWLMQIGQDRAGYYSYTWLENLFGANMTNTYELMPNMPERFVGDVVWMADKNRYGGNGNVYVLQYEKNHFMITSGKKEFEKMQKGEKVNGSWSFIVEPMPTPPGQSGVSRLILRSRGEDLTFGDKVYNFFFDPAHFIMEQKMMRTIKELVEAQS